MNKQRGIFERKPGQWYARYVDASGRLRRERAGTKAGAIKLYQKRKGEALDGRKLPERIRRSPVMFDEIARDTLEYSRLHKRSAKSDEYRMKKLMEWFKARTADSITPDEIELRLSDENWQPATQNRHRALLSLVYRLAIRSKKVQENPARLVAHRRENNIRIRFLSREEEKSLRAGIEENFPQRLPEFELALHTGLRQGEQYKLGWQDVDYARRILTVPQSKNGAMRHAPLNGSAIRAISQLREMYGDMPFVCGGWKTPREWFKLAVQKAGIEKFTWHCLRHTYASRLVMAGVDLRTVAELLGHKTLAMVMRYAHLAPDFQRAAVERMDAMFQKQTDTKTDTRRVETRAVIN